MNIDRAASSSRLRQVEFSCFSSRLMALFIWKRMCCVVPQQSRVSPSQKRTTEGWGVRRPSTCFSFALSWVTWTNKCVRVRERVHACAFTHPPSGHRKTSWRTLIHRDPVAIHSHSRVHPKCVSQRGNPFVSITLAEAFDLRDE
jgi:hypothetical protein